MNTVSFLSAHTHTYTHTLIVMLQPAFNITTEGESRLPLMTNQLFLNTHLYYSHTYRNDHFQNLNPKMQMETVFSPNAAAVAEDLLLHGEGALRFAVNKDTEILFVSGFSTVLRHKCLHTH